MTRGNKMSVEVLGIKGCEAAAESIGLVKSVAQSMGVDPDLQIIVVESAEQARRERFLGSPTVRIDGLDIEPIARDVKFYGVT